MPRFYHFCLFMFALLFFFSCKPDKSSVAPISASQKMIVGTWTLQQEQYTQYVDGQKQIDTTLNATEYNRAYVKFNSNGTFSSAGIYASPNSGSLSGGLTNAADSTSGTFSFTGTALSLSEPIAGLTTGSTLTSISVSMAPVITPVSHSVSISQLTSESLKIHTEYIYTYTVNNLSQTYKMDDDYYYTRYL
jgi:hypothetical protein